MQAPFHLALPCLNIAKTKAFYTEVLGAQVGRTSQNWIDINLYGNQITFTKSGPFHFDYKNYALGGEVLPSFHFGVILAAQEWQPLFKAIKKRQFGVLSELEFLENKPGAHRSFFIKDPNGFIVEFKNFTEPDHIFKS